MHPHISFIELERMKFFRGFEKAWRNELNKPAIEIIKLLKDKPYLVHSIENYLRVDKDSTGDLFGKTWGVSGAKFAENTFNKYRKMRSFPIQVKAEQPLSFWYEYMKNWAMNEAGDRITWINETTNEEILKQIRLTLNEASQQGLGIDETARMMRKNLIENYGNLSKFRAQRIARTEIIGASNMGQIQGAEMLGYNMKKSWLSFLDRATRRGQQGFDHVQCHGETVGLNERFVRSGEAMKVPGDPSGSAGNIINCRCTVTFEVL